MHLNQGYFPMKKNGWLYNDSSDNSDMYIDKHRHGEESNIT